MNEDAYLSALRDDPSDEVAWLALADWLDEDGQPQRAELLRLVRQLRALPDWRRTKKRTALEGRLAGLLLAGVRPAVPEVVNGIGMRLALVPAGRFSMGSPANEGGRYRSETQREAEVAR